MTTLTNQTASSDGHLPVKMPRPSFIYGTLCAKPLLALVLTGDASNVAKISHLIHPARLSGFKRLVVKYCDYPAIIQHDDSEVDSYFILLETVYQRNKVDRFECETGKPVVVHVNLLDTAGLPIQRTVEADMYVWAGEMDELSSEPWELHTFINERLSDWLYVCGGTGPIVNGDTSDDVETVEDALGGLRLEGKPI